MWELIPMALLSAIYPTLVAVVIVALAAPHPAREMAFFLLGGMIASITVGLVIVFLMHGSSAVTESNPPADPVIYLGAGVIALLLAYVVRHRKPPQREGDGRVSRLLSRSQRAAVAFSVGLLLNLAPGVWYLVALKDIAQSGWSDTTIVVVVVVFCIIQYSLIELPLLGFVFAPERAADLSRRFSAWLGANSSTLAVWILVVAGCYMLVRGVISIA
jgi:hypothetical protein